jgi:hypothetical protein
VNELDKDSVRGHELTGPVYLLVCDNGSGEEVFQLPNADGNELPLVAVDKNGLQILRHLAQEFANRFNRSASIISFTQRALYETVRPVTTGDT